MKILGISIQILLLICYTQAALFNTDICARYSPQVMDNFNVTRILGTWYYFAQSPNFKNQTDGCNSYGCFKQTITLKDSCTLVIQESYVDVLGQLITTSSERYFDSKRPNVLAQYVDVKVKDAYGRDCIQNTRVESTILYTDYDCVKLEYSCTTINNFWVATPYRYYYIAVRDKNFDSINKFLPALNYLKTAGVSCDNLQFLPLSGRCPN